MTGISLTVHDGEWHALRTRCTPHGSDANCTRERPHARKANDAGFCFSWAGQSHDANVIHARLEACRSLHPETP